MSDDYYAALGVSSKASSAEIKQRFRTIARANHPDLAGARGWPPAETARRGTKVKKAAMAYAVLSNPEHRAEYDDECRRMRAWQRRGDRRRWNPQGPATSGVPARWDGFNFEDVGGPKRPPTLHRKPKELRTDFKSFRELAAEAAERVLCELILEMLNDNF